MKIDRLSFEIGMINCFVEMVACGVKKLAISPPVTPEDYEMIKEESERIVSGFGIKSFLEKSLMVTDLQSPEFTKGKWSVLYYENDDVLETYHTLKKNKEKLEAAGAYTEDARKHISREFMRLLSYPEDKINEKLSKDKPVDPFILTEQNGE